MDLSSGLPLSLVKTGLPFDYPKLESDFTDDVVILGGGISGALLAHYFTGAGISCTVVDGRTIGLGSTCASTSLLQYEIDTPLCKLKDMVGLKHAVTAYQLGVDSIHELGAIAKTIGFPDFSMKQSLYFAAKNKDEKLIREEYKIRKESGFDVQLLEKATIDTAYHIPASLAILSQTAAQTDAYKFTHALLQYNIRRGLKVYDRTLVKKISHASNRVQLTTTNGHKITAGKLCYATGYEATQYIDKKFVQLASTYAIATEQLPAGDLGLNNQAIYWNTADPYTYMRCSADNRIIIGGRDEDFYNPVKRDALLKRKKLQLERDLQKLLGNKMLKAEFSWTGTFGSTKDGLPYIGPYEKLPNSYFALGFGGNGITFSLIAAAFLTDMVLKKKNSLAGIFSFNRS